MSEKAELLNIRGLVLRATDVGDNDRMLTVLTEKEGKLSVFVRGAKRITNGALAASQPFVCADFALAKGKERYYLREAEVRTVFAGLAASIQASALAHYFCAVANDLTYPGGEAGDILQLTLNALWTLSETEKPLAVVKGAFEFRAAALGGYMPDIRICCTCGAEDMGKYGILDIMNGRLFCAKCYETYFPELAHGTPEPYCDETGTVFLARRLTGGALGAMRYILATPAKRQFSFVVGDDDLPFFSEACEAYLLNHMEHGYKTLTYYKETCGFADELAAMISDLQKKREDDTDGASAETVERT